MSEPMGYYRCEESGNIIGTDTHAVGKGCLCQRCRLTAEVDDLTNSVGIQEREIGRLTAELESEENYVHCDRIVNYCLPLLPKGHSQCYDETPMELIAAIVNDRDELRQQLAEATEKIRSQKDEICQLHDIRVSLTKQLAEANDGKPTREQAEELEQQFAADGKNVPFEPEPNLERQVKSLKLRLQSAVQDRQIAEAKLATARATERAACVAFIRDVATKRRREADCQIVLTELADAIAAREPKQLIDDGPELPAIDPEYYM